MENADAPNADERPLIELEDLVPLPLAQRAASQFATLILGWPPETLPTISEEAIKTEMQQENDCAFFAINRIFANTLQSQGEVPQKEALGKVTFARLVIDLLPVLAHERADKLKNEPTFGATCGLDEFERTMRVILRRLREMQAETERSRKEKSMRGRVEEKVGTFLSDYGDRASAPRDVARRALMEVEGELVEGDEEEISYIRQQIVRLVTEHSLREDPASLIRDYADFLRGLEYIRTAREQLDIASSPPTYKTVVDISESPEKTELIPSTPVRGEVEKVTPEKKNQTATKD